MYANATYDRLWNKGINTNQHECNGGGNEDDDDCDGVPVQYQFQFHEEKKMFCSMLVPSMSKHARPCSSTSLMHAHRL